MTTCVGWMWEITGIQISDRPEGPRASWGKCPRTLFLAHLTDSGVEVERLGFQTSWPAWLEGPGQVLETWGLFCKGLCGPQYNAETSSRGREGWSLPWITAWTDVGQACVHGEA